MRIVHANIMIEPINTDAHLLDVYSETISNVYNSIAPSVVHIRNVANKEEKRNSLLFLLKSAKQNFMDYINNSLFCT